MIKKLKYDKKIWYGIKNNMNTIRIHEYIKIIWIKKYVSKSI